MQHRRRWATAGAAVLGVGLLLAWWLRPTGPPEPVYKGRPLSAWLDDFNPVRGQQPSPATYWAAVEATHAIGPAAIPTLVAWYREPSQPIREQMLGWLWRRGLTGLVAQLPTVRDNWSRARTGFECLGPAGRPAYPALADIMLHSADETLHNMIQETIGDYDASLARQVVAALHDPDPAVRARAVCGLDYGGRLVADEITIPALESLQDDPDPGVRWRASMAQAMYLAKLDKLASVLSQDNPEVLVNFLPFVGAYRARARHLLPQIEPLTRHADPAVRAAARAAIEQIAPTPAP